jgi:hypothetical protein
MQISFPQPRIFTIYSQLQENGQISLQTLWALMQRGGLLTGEVDYKVSHSAKDKTLSSPAKE